MVAKKATPLAATYHPPGRLRWATATNATPQAMAARAHGMPRLPSLSRNASDATPRKAGSSPPSHAVSLQPSGRALERSSPSFRPALMGTNAAVVGILLAALYEPIWVSAVTSVPDALVAVVVFVLLVVLRIPPWAAVLISATAGEALSRS
jgi:hypothetical protein